VPGLEWCELAPTPAGTALRGAVLLAWEEAPWSISYSIELDEQGQTRRVGISADGGADPVSFSLEANGAGRWLRDGAVVIDSADALDVDLGFSPSTNTLPIRRLGLAVGESRQIGVAWILFPSFEIEYGVQTYDRLAERRWRYRSTGFEAELTVDEEGLVESYAEWEAIARS
jgi:uncharacterized protein